MDVMRLRRAILVAVFMLLVISLEGRSMTRINGVKQEATNFNEVEIHGRKDGNFGPKLNKYSKFSSPTEGEELDTIDMGEIDYTSPARKKSPIHN